MQLNISHTTRYTYESPVSYGLQELRLSPKSGPGQQVVRWDITVEGGTKEACFTHQHDNTVWLVSFSGGRREIVVNSTGVVETTENAGVRGPHRGIAPLW